MGLFNFKKESEEDKLFKKQIETFNKYPNIEKNLETQSVFNVLCDKYGYSDAFILWYDKQTFEFQEDDWNKKKNEHHFNPALQFIKDCDDIIFNSEDLYTLFLLLESDGINIKKYLQVNGDTQLKDWFVKYRKYGSTACATAILSLNAGKNENEIEEFLESKITK